MLLASLAFADPVRIGVRGDFGLGIDTRGGIAARLGVSPEVWGERWGAGVRLSYDGDLDPGLLSGEVDFRRIEPWALYEIEDHWYAGGGVGAALATEYAGFWGGDASPTQVVATGSVLVGWVPPRRWFGLFARLDGTSFPSTALTVSATVSPGLPVGR